MLSMTPSSRLIWLVALCFVPVCALPAIASGTEQFIVWAALAICVVAVFDAALSRNRLAGFSVVLPESIRCLLNEPQTLRVELHRAPTSGKWTGTVRLGLLLPAELETVASDVLLRPPAPGLGIATEMTVLGWTRGQFRIEQVFLGAASAGGLWHVRRAVMVQANVLVQPSLSRIAKETAKLLASRSHGGHRIVARNGRGREFEQLREYVPSDDFGDIDWKATARRRFPIVRDYQIERTQDIYACIDHSRLSARSIARKDETRAIVLDEYIRSALMLQCAVRETGDRFGLATFGKQVGYFVKATNAVSFENAFRRALYPLVPQMAAPGFDEICGLLRQRVKRRALMIFFTSLAEPQLAESFLAASQLLARQHLVVVACPADEYAKPLFSEPDAEQVQDVYDRFAGHVLWKKLTEVRLQLANKGIRMQSIAPGRLGLAAVTEYLDIKERQLL